MATVKIDLPTWTEAQGETHFPAFAKEMRRFAGLNKYTWAMKANLDEIPLEFDKKDPIGVDEATFTTQNGHLFALLDAATANYPVMNQIVTSDANFGNYGKAMLALRANCVGNLETFVEKLFRKVEKLFKGITSMRQLRDNLKIIIETNTELKSYEDGGLEVDFTSLSDGDLRRRTADAIGRIDGYTQLYYDIKTSPKDPRWRNFGALQQHITNLVNLSAAEDSDDDKPAAVEHAMAAKEPAETDSDLRAVIKALQAQVHELSTRGGGGGGRAAAGRCNMECYACGKADWADKDAFWQHTSACIATPPCLRAGCTCPHTHLAQFHDKKMAALERAKERQARKARERGSARAKAAKVTSKLDDDDHDDDFTGFGGVEHARMANSAPPSGAGTPDTTALVPLDSQCSRHGAGKAWLKRMLPETIQMVDSKLTPPYENADGSRSAVIMKGVVPMHVPCLGADNVTVEGTATLYVEVYIVPDWPPEQILLSQGQMRDAIPNANVNGAKIIDTDDPEVSILEACSLQGGEMRRLRTALAWVGREGRKTLYLRTVPGDKGAEEANQRYRDSQKWCAQPMVAPGVPAFRAVTSLMAHKIFFHAPRSVLEKLEANTTGLTLLDDPSDLPVLPDEACLHGKSTKAGSNRKAGDGETAEPNRAAQRITEIVFVDYHDYGKDFGDNPPPGAASKGKNPDLQGAIGYWSFNTRSGSIKAYYNVQEKTGKELINVFGKFRQKYGTPDLINIDRDPVAVSTSPTHLTAFEEHCLRPDVMTKVRTSAVGAHWQNGPAEGRGGRRVYEAVTAACKDMGVPGHEYRSYAIDMLAHVLDRTPDTKLNGKTPYYMRVGKDPPTAHLHRPFCPVLINIPKEKRTPGPKWRSRVHRGVYLGPAEGQALGTAVVHNLDTGKVHTSRDIYYDDHCRLIEQTAGGWRWKMDEFDRALVDEGGIRRQKEVYGNLAAEICAHDDAPAVPAAMRRQAGDESGADADPGAPGKAGEDEMSPSLPESASDEPLRAPPGFPSVPVCSLHNLTPHTANSAHTKDKPTREMLFPGHKPMTWDQIKDKFDFSKADKHFREFADKHGREKSEQAFKDEYKQLCELGAAALVELPIGYRALKSRTVMKKKAPEPPLYPEGNERVKARATPKGYAEVEGRDFELHELPSPVADRTSQRLADIIAVKCALNLDVVDVKGAFLRGELPETKVILVESDPALDLGTGPGGRPMVFLCLVPWYGLRESPALWNATLGKFLAAAGYLPSTTDPCVYFHKDNAPLADILEGKGTYAAILAHVDDLKLVFSSASAMAGFKSELSAKFPIEDYGAIEKCVGIEYEKVPGGFRVHLGDYARKFVAEFGLEGAHPTKVPMTEATYNQLEAEAPKLEGADLAKYLKGVGNLIYMPTTLTRPDLAAVAQVLASARSRATTRHLAALKSVVRYIAGTTTAGVEIKEGGGSGLVLEWYSDATWASCPVTRRSVSGGHATVGGVPVFFMCRKQKSVALSSGAAETVAMSANARELVVMRRRLAEFGAPQAKATVMFADNAAAIAMAENKLHLTELSRHLAVRDLFVRECEAEKILGLKFVRSADNIADFFTKVLGEIKFLAFRAVVWGVSGGL